MNYGNIAFGAVVGASWAILGAASNKSTAWNPDVPDVPDSFKVLKFLKGPIIGAGIGAVAGAMDLPLTDASFETLAANTMLLTGLTDVANRGLKIIYNFCKKHF